MEGARILVLLLVACAPGPTEAEVEAGRVAALVPARVRADGALVLSADDRDALGVETLRVERGRLAVVRQRFGTVRARPSDEGVVASSIAGRVVAVTDLVPGERVDAETTLVELAPVLATGEQVALGTQRVELEGRIRSARAQLMLDETTLARAKELAGSAAVSRQSVDEAQTRMAGTRASLSALERARAVQRRASGTTVELGCPLSGRLVALLSELGAVVASGTVIARCRRDGPRWIELIVPAEDTVGRGYQARIGARWVPAELLAQGIEVSGGVRRDRLIIDDADALPGTTVGIRVTTSSADGLLVPRNAVIAQGGRDLVMIESEPNTFAARVITIGLESDDRVLVTDGVGEGDLVVTRGAMALLGERERDGLQPQE